MNITSYTLYAAFVLQKRVVGERDGSPGDHGTDGVPVDHVRTGAPGRPGLPGRDCVPDDEETPGQTGEKGGRGVPGTEGKMYLLLLPVLRCLCNYI